MFVVVVTREMTASRVPIAHRDHVVADLFAECRNPGNVRHVLLDDLPSIRVRKLVIRRPALRVRKLVCHRFEYYAPTGTSFCIDRRGV